MCRTAAGRVIHQLFNGGDLLAVAVFLQSAQQRPDLFHESVFLGAFQLVQYFLCNGVSEATRGNGSRGIPYV